MTGFETLGRVPGCVTAGDSYPIRLSELSASYPVASYRLQIAMTLGTANPVLVDLANSAGVHGGTLSFASAAPGAWRYAIKATRLTDGLVQTVATGTIQVNPDPARHDVRSHAERVLEAIEALIEGRATTDVQSYSIAGRSLTRMTPAELVTWRSHYRQDVAMERAAGKPGAGRRIRLASFR